MLAHDEKNVERVRQMFKQGGGLRQDPETVRSACASPKQDLKEESHRSSIVAAPHLQPRTETTTNTMSRASLKGPHPQSLQGVPRFWQPR